MPAEMITFANRLIVAGPNEITVYRPQAIDLFERSHTRKSEWYDVLKPKTSAVFERNDTSHKARRRLWSQAMSVQCEAEIVTLRIEEVLTSATAIQEYLPRILEQVSTLVELVDQYQGTPVLINDLMAWFSFDSMGEFMFNESFHMMTSRKMHPAIVQQKNALALLGIFTESIWIVRLAFKLVPFYGLVKQWLDMVAFCDGQMDKRIRVCLHP